MKQLLRSLVMAAAVLVGLSPMAQALDIVSQDNRLDFYLKINGVQTYVGGFRPLVSDQGGYGFHVAKVTPGVSHDQYAPLEFRAENFSTIRRNGEQVEIVGGDNGNANFAVVSRNSAYGTRFEVRNPGDTAGIVLDYSTAVQPKIKSDGAVPLRVLINEQERARINATPTGVETALVVFTDGSMRDVKIGPVGSGPGGYGRALWIEP